MTSWRLPKIRRPRAEIEPFVDVLRAELPTDVEWHLMGSYRRGAEVVGDLDVLVITDDGELQGDLWKPGIVLPPSVDWDRLGPKIAQGSLFLADNDYVHVDVWSATPKMRGAMLMFSTGPMSLNVVQRKRAISMGYRLSQNGLFDAENKRQLDDGTEENIYRWLGLDYMTPQQREKWAEKKPPTPKPYPPVQRHRREVTMPNGAQKAAMNKALAEKREQTDQPADTAPKKAAPPKVTPRRLEFGGIKCNVEDCKEALAALKKAKSMFVAQPLRAVGNPLATSDYHAIAKVEFGKDETLRKAPHPTKTAYVRALEAFIARHDKGNAAS